MTNRRKTQPAPSVFGQPSLFDDDALAEITTASAGEDVATADVEKVAHRDPSLDEWRRAYAAAAELRSFEPCEWMYEDQLVAVVNPEDGEVGYCSVMGAGGDYIALAVYLGREGLASYERLRQAVEGADHTTQKEAYLRQRALVASFEGRDDVDGRDRKVFQELGLRFRGRTAWPVLRGRDAGRVPRHITAKECRFLIYALEQTLDVAVRLLKDQDLLGQQPGRMLTRRAVDAAADEWVDDWLDIPDVLEEVDDAWAFPSVEIDEMRVKRLMRSGRRGGTWQVDITFGPFVLADEDPPYFPWLMLCLDRESGMILATHTASLDTDGEEFAEVLVATMEQLGVYPGTFEVCRRRAALLTLRIAHGLGAEVYEYPSLGAVEEVMEEMAGMMDRW